MKFCPICQNTYTNNALRFCLQDGTELVAAQSVAPHDSEATLVAPKFPSHPAQVVPLAPQTAPAYHAPTKSSGWGWKIAASALVLILAGATGLFFLLRERETPARAVNGSDGPEVRLSAPKRPTTTPETKPATVAKPEIKATPADDDVSALAPEQLAEAESDISDALESWADDLRNHDLDAFVSHYASRVEVYYRFRNYTLAQVRADKARAFAKYYEMDGKISDLSVEVEPSGRRATAIFLKTYYFKGDEKDFSGATRAQMTMVKSADGWLIAGERDL